MFLIILAKGENTNTNYKRRADLLVANLLIVCLRIGTSSMVVDKVY